MKIAVVTSDLRVGGGVAEMALFVARSLRRQLGAEVRLISLATSSVDASSRLLARPRTWAREAHTSFTHEEFAVDHIGAVAAEIEVARYLPRGPLRERLADCDVVHVVAGIPAWAWAVSGFAGPVVLHFASLVRHERASQQGAWYAPAVRWRRVMTQAVSVIERAALRRADVVLTLNDTRRHEVEELTRSTARSATVPVGVDTDWFTPGPYNGDGYLLTVGRLNDPRKNVPLLLRAYAAARARSSRVPRLVLAGHVPPAAECRELIGELGLSAAVEYRGPLDRAQLAEAYRGASAFVLSSNEEGQGIVILEAMAAGLPVVATSCVGPPELVDDGREGLLVPVGSVASLADAIVQVSTDPALRHRLSSAARARAVREFSLDATGLRLSAAYRDAGLVAPRQERTVSPVREAKRVTARA